MSRKTSRKMPLKMSRKSRLISLTLSGLMVANLAVGETSVAYAEPSPALAAAPQESKAPVKKRKKRKVESMTLAINKKVSKAQEHIEAKDYAAANKMLTDMKDSRKINNYELAIVWQLFAQLAYEQEDVKGTIRAYEEVLKLKDSIPEAQEVGIIFNLSQLNYSQEDYAKAIDYYKQWEAKAEIIGVRQIIYGAQLYYVIEDYPRAIDYTRKAISEAEAVETVDVEENWYGLLLSAHWQLGEYEQVRDVLETLIINWPAPQYWQQLAGAYQELGEEETSYSILEAAYKQGFLDDKPAQLQNLAQILISRQAPIKAAWVLEAAYRDGLIEKTAKNQRTLGTAYMRSAEYAKATGPLSAAAKGDNTLDPDGTIWLQIAAVQNGLEKLDDSVAAYDNAIRLLRQEESGAVNRKKLRAAYMQRAGILIELKRYAEARESLDQARTLGEKRSAINNWTKYLQAEEARQKILDSAGR